MQLGIVAPFLFLTTAWGSTYVFIKMGLVHWPPALLVASRNLTAGLIMLLVVLALRRPWPRTWAETWPPILFGLVNATAQVLLSALMYGLSFLISKRCFKGEVFVNTSLFLLVAGVGLLFVSLVLEGVPALPPRTLAAFGPVIYLAVVPAALAYSVQVYFVRRTAAIQSGYPMLTAPVAGLLLGLLLLGEPLTLAIVGGTVLVVLGAWLVIAPLRSRRAITEVSEEEERYRVAMLNWQVDQAQRRGLDPWTSAR